MNDVTTPDILRFWQSWSANPLRVAAIAPSGKALAALITQDVSAATGPIIELGPGTGVFTRAMLARGVNEADLTLLENGDEFIELLRRRFPAARVLQSDAASLKRNQLFARAEVGAVISGIPILSMAARQQLAILGGAFALLREGGCFYQFTYGLRCPVPVKLLDRLELTAESIGRVYLNLPPASVYKISRAV